MTPGRSSKNRTGPCNRHDAQKRLTDATRFLEHAELVEDHADHGSTNASVSNAVLAGIAASDALCCWSIGERSLGDDHRQAQTVLRQIEPNGAAAANALARLLALKTDAQYGLDVLSNSDHANALRQARKLVEFAREALRD